MKSLTRNSWSCMMGRCYRPATACYADYGGRGILVCERWHKYANFVEDMGERPSKQHTLDRIDSSRGYEPGNVRWATKGEQRRNCRAINLLTYNGRSQCLTDWATEIGVTPMTIYRRLRSKWPIERVLARGSQRNEKFERGPWIETAYRGAR